VRALRRLGIPQAIGAGLVVAAVLTASCSPAPCSPRRRPTGGNACPSRHARRSSTRPTACAAPCGRRPPPPRAQAEGGGRPAHAGATDAIADKIASEGVTVTRVVLVQTLSFAVETAATVILLYFLLASEHWLVSRTVEAAPRRRTRALVLGGIRQAQREIGLYLGTMSLINLGLARRPASRSRG
jgi:hypothetical protein